MRKYHGGPEIILSLRRVGERSEDFVATINLGSDEDFTDLAWARHLDRVIAEILTRRRREVYPDEI